MHLLYYTHRKEYEDLLDEDYELLQENLGIKITVSCSMCISA